MEKSDAIVLALLAYMWMGILAVLAVVAALTSREGLQGFISLAVTLWPVPLIQGFSGIYTITFPIMAITGWEPDKNPEAKYIKITSVFLILIVIAVYVFFNNLFKLDPSIGPLFWPAMFVVAIPGFIICYPLVYSLITPLTDEQVSDFRELELDLNLPYDEAFIRCKDAIDLIDATDYTYQKTSDPNAGTLSIDAFPRFYVGYPKKPTRITISLAKTDATIITQVKISAVTLPQLARIPSDLNDGYVNRVAGYLRGKSSGMSDDDSPPAGSA